MHKLVQVIRFDSVRLGPLEKTLDGIAVWGRRRFFVGVLLSRNQAVFMEQVLDILADITTAPFLSRIPELRAVFIQVQVHASLDFGYDLHECVAGELRR